MAKRRRQHKQWSYPKSSAGRYGITRYGISGLGRLRRRSFGAMAITLPQVKNEVMKLDGPAVALGVAAAARWFGTAGTFISNHAGLLGSLAAIAYGLVRKNTTSAVTGAATGLGIEAFEYVSDQRTARL